ncbi:zona pellucida sperm-binding protein 3-like [Chanos chanos]|uniref:Zona pellucida sperm-binding protein 3 n=1 Tax=Chanos chanos TaxID=29144 RepID=A0A6J2VT40_CHACN|nr:zona pellucida sperm-binding protein 3-like [Chanos chanos]
MDFLGIGKLIKPSDITLGGCAPTGQDDDSKVLLFETPLHGCGSALQMSENLLIYNFVLTHNPTPSGDEPIVKTNSATVHIECQYLRFHNVSSKALSPTRIPFVATKMSEERLAFSLKLMTDNWRFARPSNVYFFGDTLNIEASVLYNYGPLRVFVDYCVASLVPEANEPPIYGVIENHGCLMDSKQTHSNSKFLARVQNDKLYFQLKSFRFAQQEQGPIFLTCMLRAIAVPAAVDAENKACSFSDNRWTSADGNDEVCSCCDTTCSLRKGRALKGSEHQDVVTVGPVVFKEYRLTSDVPSDQTTINGMISH